MLCGLGCLVILVVATDTELLSRQLNVAISPRTLSKLHAIEKQEGITPPAFARVAIAEKLDGQNGELIRVSKELRRLGVDPISALRGALEASIKTKK